MLLGVIPSVFAALALLQAPIPATGGDSLTYEPPAGWSRHIDPQNHATYLSPVGLGFGRTCVIGVFGPQLYGGSADAYHDFVVKVARFGARTVEPPRRGTEGGFVTSTFKQKGLIGPVNTIAIYTARWGDRGQAIIFSTNSDELANAYLPVVQAFVRAIVIPGGGGPVATAGAPASTPPPSTSTPASDPGATAAAQTSTNPATVAAPMRASQRRADDFNYHPKPVPIGDQVVPIVGAYISTGARTSYSVSDGVRSRVGTTMLVLYANGVAARASLTKANTIDDTYYAEGFATVNPNDFESLGMRQSGHWSESAGTISIEWSIGGTQRLQRSGRNLDEQYSKWTPYASVDGLRLQGQFVHVLPFGPPMVLGLGADGTFTADEVNNSMGGTIVNPEFPEHGAGTYEISRWSLILRFNTGFVQSINLLLGGDDPKTTSTLVLNGWDFVRR